MPSELSRHSDCIVILRFFDDYSFDEVMAGIDSAPGLAAGEQVSLIFDVRDSQSPRSTDDFRQMVAKLHKDPRFLKKHASVIQLQSELYYGMTRQMQSMADVVGIVYGLFGTIEEAVSFLES
jgi:hypothetical protein